MSKGAAASTATGNGLPDGTRHRVDTLDEIRRLAAVLVQITEHVAVLLATPPPAPRDQAPAGLDLVITVEEAARELRCGRTTIYALIRDGDLPSVRIGTLRRIRTNDLRTYIDRLAAEKS